MNEKTMSEKYGMNIDLVYPITIVPQRFKGSNDPIAPNVQLRDYDAVHSVIGDTGIARIAEYLNKWMIATCDVYLFDGMCSPDKPEITDSDMCVEELNFTITWATFRMRCHYYLDNNALTVIFV